MNRTASTLAKLLILFLSLVALAPAAQAQSCTYSLNPTSASFPAGGGNGSVQVSIPSTCFTTGSFFAKSNDFWIQLTNGLSQPDGSRQYVLSDTVRYAVAPNTGPSAVTGTITIAGKTFSVTLAGTGSQASCVYTMNPKSASYPASGGSGSFTISIPDSCITTGEIVLQVSDPWIYITNGFDLDGGRFQYFGNSWTVKYTVAPNPYPGADTGTIRKEGGGPTFTVYQAGTGSSSGTFATAVEYYHAAFGHYFVTVQTDEIDLLDSGFFQGWARTGQTFKVYTSGAGLADVCRFFTVAFAPKSSHFYTAIAGECGFVKQNPDWIYEKIAFKVALRDAFGSCPAGTIPLYRVYNNGQTGAPNHRYTTNPTIRAQMLNQGFVPEDDNTVCVPN